MPLAFVTTYSTARLFKRVGAEQTPARKIVEPMINPNSNMSMRLAAPAVIAGGMLAAVAVGALAPANAVNDLKSGSDFQQIQETAERSRAIFAEIGKLLTNPRCMNCHPASDRPLQGDDHHPHMPPVWRGENGHFATDCFGCHTQHNVSLHEAASYQSIPGHPRWGVAPSSMAWEGKSLGEICRQLKDVERNGGRNLAMLREHIGTDDLVGWAWRPGAGRDPAPGSQEAAGQLVQAWIDTGAECPQ